MAHIDDVLDTESEERPLPAAEQTLREITPEPALTLVESVQPVRSRLQQLKDQLSKLPN